MAWKRCCCCRVSSLCLVLAVSWAVLGAYAISFNINNNPTWAWNTLSWDTSKVEVDLSPRQDLRFGYRGNSTTSVSKYLHTHNVSCSDSEAGVKSAWSARLPLLPAGLTL